MLARSLSSKDVCLSVCSTHADIVSKQLNQIPGYPFSGGVKYTRAGKICGNRRLSRKRNRIGPWLLWNVNRKSRVPDRMASTWVSRSYGIFTSRISPKRCVLWTKLLGYRTLIGKHTQFIEWYHFQWPWVTSDPDFKFTTYFEVQSAQKRHEIEPYITIECQ